MNRLQRPIARIGAITLVVALTLTGCGSRLSYSKVLAENAALGAAGAAGSSAGGSAGSGSATGGASGGSGGTTGGGTTSSGGQTSSSGGTNSSSGGGSQSSSGGASSGGASSSGPATGSTINIGQIGLDSGLFGTLFGQAVPALHVWAAYVNANGGLNGHKVNVITADSGGDPSTALADAKTMVNQDHVIAFLDSTDALSTPTLAPYLASVGVPDIAGTDAETQWYSNPDLYPGGASIRQSEDGAIQYGITQGKPKIGILYCVEFALICSTAAAQTTKDAPTMGGTVVYNQQISLASPDYTSECLGAKSAGVQQLQFYGDPASAIRLMSDCHNQGYSPLFTTVAIIFSPALLVSSNTVAGLVGATPWFPFMVQSPATAQFDNAFQQYTGGPPNSEFDSFSWVGGLIMQAASKNLPAANPTSADLIAGLDTIQNDTFGGLATPVTYQAGQPAVSSTCSFFMTVQSNGTYGAPNGLQQTCLPASFAQGTQ